MRTGSCLLTIAACIAMIVPAGSMPPAWWSTGTPPVIDPAATANSHAPANIGQAKWMAKNALAALRAVDDAAADLVETDLVGADLVNPNLAAAGKIIANWDPPSNAAGQAAQRAPLLIGQLKAIADPFYRNLSSSNATWLNSELQLNGTKDPGNPMNFFPWTSATEDDNNKAVATIGQLKAVFSLRFETFISLSEQGSLRDRDGDRIPNLWETQRGTSPLDKTASPAVDATVDGSQSTNASLKRYQTLQEAYNAVPAVISGSSTPYYAVIVVKPGTYTGSLSCNALKKIVWLADNAKGLVTLKPSGVAVLLNDATLMDGFVISGNGGNTNIGISVVPHAGLAGVPPKIRIVNSVIVSRWSASVNNAGVVNNGGDLSLVHCTLADNLGGTTSGKAKAITNLGKTVTLINTIVGQQSTTANPLVPPVWTDVSPTASITTSGTVIKGGLGQWSSTDVDPALIQLWHLSAGDPVASPVKQKGVLNSGVKTDIYGQPRPENRVAPDLGAEQWNDEFIPAPELAVSAVTVNSVSLSWTNVENEHSYRIERSADGVTFTKITTTPAILPVDTVSYLNASLAQNTPYYYRIIAEHAQQNSLPSNVVLAHMTPVAPTSVNANTGTPNGFKVTWAHGANQSYYLVQGSSSLPGNTWSTWADIASVPKDHTSVIISNLTEKTKYRVRVIAVNPSGSAYSSLDPATTSTTAEEDTTAAAPSTPSGLSITAAAATTATLTWVDTANNETGYKVEYSTNGGSTWSNLTTSVLANATTYNATGLSGSANYRFRVTAVNTWAGSTLNSSPSNQVELPAMPVAPSNVSAVAQNSNAVNVTWTLPTDAARTLVRIRSTKTGDASPRLNVDLGPSALSYTDQGLVASTSYSYQISCVNARGEVYGSTSTVTTPSDLPSAPAITTTVLGPRSVKVNWTDKWNNELGFTIERSKTVSSGPWTVIASLPANSSATPLPAMSYTDTTGLEGATVYYYKLKVTNPYGSTYSPAVSATTSAHPANNAPDALAITPFNQINYQIKDFAPSSTPAPWHSVACDRLGPLWVLPSLVSGNAVPGIWTGPDQNVATGLVGLVPSDTYDSSQEYGAKVVVSGFRIFVSAPNALKTPGNAGSGRCGAVYIFDWNGTAVSQVARLVPADGAAGDRFGDSLAADGSRLIIGAPKKDVTISSTAFTDVGRVYLYDRATSGTWSLTRSELPTTPENLLNFGAGVAVRGRHFVIGAPNQDNIAVSVSLGGGAIYTKDLLDAGALYFGKWNEPAGNLDLFENPIVGEVAGVNPFSIPGIGYAHFGAAVAMDASLAITVTAPDHSWSSTDTAMAPFAGGNVFKVFWNGGLRDGWVGRFARIPIPTTFNQQIGLTVKWDAVDHLSEITSAGWGSGLVSLSIRTDIGNEIGTRCADLAGFEPDGDPLTYAVITGVPPSYGDWPAGILWTVPTSAGPAQFEIQQEPAGVFYLASKTGAGLVSGVYTVGLRISDDRGGVKDIHTLVHINGSSPSFTDADHDGMDDNWEILHGLDPTHSADAGASLGGDGLTSREKYLRYVAGMSYGVDPNRWDLRPDGDEDGDGILNKFDADPFDPLIKALSLQILQPGNSGTY